MYIDYGYVHKITTSASLIYFFLVSSSFLNSEGGEIISRSSRASILPRTCSPVVPVSPSINTLYFAAKRLVVVDDDRRFDEGANPNVLGAQHSRIAAIESFIFSGMVCNYRIFVLFFLCRCKFYDLWICVEASFMSEHLSYRARFVLKNQCQNLPYAGNNDGSM